MQRIVSIKQRGIANLAKAILPRLIESKVFLVLFAISAPFVVKMEQFYSYRGRDSEQT